MERQIRNTENLLRNKQMPLVRLEQLKNTVGTGHCLWYDDTFNDVNVDREFFEEIRQKDGLMKPYVKDRCGHEASPINS